VEERAVYTVEEAAGLLGLAVRNVYPMLAAGEIPARQIGVRWVIGKERFHAWLNGRDEPVAVATSTVMAKGGR
jgi:excisionase family DNA binding protein